MAIEVGGLKKIASILEIAVMSKDSIVIEKAFSATIMTKNAQVIGKALEVAVMTKDVEVVKAMLGSIIDIEKLKVDDNLFVALIEVSDSNFPSIYPILEQLLEKGTV